MIEGSANREHRKMSHEFGVTCLCKIPELAKPLNSSILKNSKYQLYSFRAIFILYYFSKASLNIHTHFKTSCLPVASLIWVCLELRSDIHHLFASVFSLLKTQVRKIHQQGVPTCSLSIKASVTGIMIEDRLPRNSFDINAHGRKFRKEKGCHSSERHIVWVKWKCLQDELFFRTYLQVSGR